MVIPLVNRSLIQISGDDSEVFLQSQFSNDVKKIQDNKIQINSYCQHQGKIIAIIWLFNKNKKYYLSIPNELKDIVLSRLNMFKLMSRIEINDVSDREYQYGLINENNVNSMRIIDNLSLLITREPITEHHDYAYWEDACINLSLPEIHINTSEKFTPQALNLDINEIGVSFSKGCYPGQEVVARMHYLGEPKRRLFRFTSQFEVSIGDNLNVKDSQSLKSSGQIIRVIKKGAEFHFLGVFDVNHTQERIFLNNDQNKLVSIINV